MPKRDQIGPAGKRKRTAKERKNEMAYVRMTTSAKFHARIKEAAEREGIGMAQWMREAALDKLANNRLDALEREVAVLREALERQEPPR